MSKSVEIIHEQNESWLKQANRCLSPNHDSRPDESDISVLVIHGISLPPAEYGGPYVQQLFTNTLDPAGHPYFAEIHHLRVSTHIFIDRAGDITQFVPFNLRAWHAGESSFCGRNQCNDFSIGIELEGCDDEPYETIQIEKLAQVTHALMQTWPKISTDRIVGHADIAPGRKTDPGPGFNWQKYFDRLSELRNDTH